MKKLSFLALLTFAVSIAPSTYAAEATHTVAQAMKAEQYSTVKLSGKIISRIDEKRYLFEDDTGTLELKIDKKVQQYSTIPTKEKILIYGKVDHYGKKTEVDVTSIIKQ